MHDMVLLSVTMEVVMSATGLVSVTMEVVMFALRQCTLDTGVVSVNMTFVTPDTGLVMFATGLFTSATGVFTSRTALVALATGLVATRAVFSTALEGPRDALAGSFARAFALPFVVWPVLHKFFARERSARRQRRRA